MGCGRRVGYGLTPSLDIEAKAATFKGLNYFGVDAEYWLVHGPNVNVSAALGVHLTDSKGGADSSGIDTSLLFSTRPAKPLEIYGGLKLSFDSVKNSDQNFTLAHLVPESSTASAPTSISWPSSASPSTTTPEAMPAWAWRYIFAEVSRPASEGAWNRTIRIISCRPLFYANMIRTSPCPLRRRPEKRRIYERINVVIKLAMVYPSRTKENISAELLYSPLIHGYLARHTPDHYKSLFMTNMSVPISIPTPWMRTWSLFPP